MNRTNHTGVTISSVAPLRNISFRNIDAVGKHRIETIFFDPLCCRSTARRVDDGRERRKRERESDL